MLHITDHMQNNGANSNTAGTTQRAEHSSEPGNRGYLVGHEFDAGVVGGGGAGAMSNPTKPHYETAEKVP